MSIFNKILHAIFGSLAPKLSPGELNLILAEKALDHPEHLDWQNSIVDLMKLVGLDSSLDHRKELALELGYQGTLDGSAEMNIWLYSRVMAKLAEHEGKSII